MADRFPFSGDVWQSINPWRLFFRQMGQIGLVNINFAKTPDPGLEQTIVEEVGSYGRQIGRLADALDVVVGTLDRKALSEKQMLAIAAFRDQLQAVRAVKARGRTPEPDLGEPTPRLRPEAVAGDGAALPAAQPRRTSQPR